MNMYRDETNNADDPTIIERSFSVFEREMSELINGKILNQKKVEINRTELESLRIFLELLSFRSDSRMKQYKEKNFDRITKDILKSSQPNEDFEDLWKKELLALTKCRSYEDIEKNKELDGVVKLEFINSIEGYYMTIIEARGGEFLLSDIYPTVEVYHGIVGDLYLHQFFPISPTKALVLNSIAFRKDADKSDPVVREMIDISRFKGNAMKVPSNNYKFARNIHVPEDRFSYTPVKVYKKEVEYINALVLNEARIGLMFRDTEKIASSVSNFNEREGTKASYKELESIICQQNSPVQ